MLVFVPFRGLGLEDGRVPTFWLPVQRSECLPTVFPCLPGVFLLYGIDVHGYD